MISGEISYIRRKLRTMSLLLLGSQLLKNLLLRSLANLDVGVDKRSARVMLLLVINVLKLVLLGNLSKDLLLRSLFDVNISYNPS